MMVVKGQEEPVFSPILFYVKEKSNSFGKKSMNYDIAM